MDMYVLMMVTHLWHLQTALGMGLTLAPSTLAYLTSIQLCSGKDVTPFAPRRWGGPGLMGKSVWAVLQKLSIPGQAPLSRKPPHSLTQPPTLGQQYSPLPPCRSRTL